MTRVVILAWSMIMAIPALGQPTQDSTMPYQIPAPEKWGKETIPLPPEFAPDMKWQGVEELRFAPNFLKPDSATFFSYALLFWLPKTKNIEAMTLENELLAYYRGLATAVSTDREQPIDVTPFTITVIAIPSKNLKRASGEDMNVFAGELNWIEPFTTGNPQTIHMDIEVWRSSNYDGRCVFICASPQPKTARVWLSLSEIRRGTTTDHPFPLPKAALQTNDTAQIAEYVVEAFEDSKGILWFGTMNYGVARFDGTTLTYLTEKDGLCGNTVVSIAEDKEGSLWFGTHTGVCKYDGEKFTELSDMESRVRSDREGNIWVGTNTGVFRFDGNSLSPFDVPIDRAEITSYSITPGRVKMALEDSKGNLWFSTDGAGAFKFDGKSFTHFTKKDGLCSNIVSDIMEDAKGSFWFTCVQASQPSETGDGGVCRYDGTSFTKFPEVIGLSTNDIYTIYEEESGNIWVGATHVGAYRFNGNTFTLFDQTDREDLTVNFGVQAILEDSKGTLWFGFSGGLFRFNGVSFVNVTRGGPWTIK